MGEKLVKKSAFAELAGVRPSAITKACRGQLLPAMVGNRVDANHPAALAYLESRRQATAPPPATGIDPRYEEAVSVCESTGRWTITHVQKQLGVGFERASAMFAMMKAAGLVPDKPQPQAVPAQEPAPAPAKAKPRSVPRRPAPPEPDEGPDTGGLPDDIADVADLTLRELVQRFGTKTAFKDWLGALKMIEDIREKRNKNAEKEGILIPRELVETHVIGQFEQSHINLLTDAAETMATRLHAMYAAGATADEGREFIKATISKNIRSAKATIARVLKNA